MADPVVRLNPEASNPGPAADRALRIVVVTGEASGDNHAAAVLETLQTSHPGITSFGIGGESLRRAGMELLGDVRDLGLMGYVETLVALGRVLPAWRRLEEAIRSRKPDCALLVDSWELNRRVTPLLKELGVPIVYYVAPKLWASRPGRAKKLAESVERLCVIFPFEVEFLAKLGVKAQYVGNPTFDAFSRAPILPLTLPPDDHKPSGPVIAFLPGSRHNEVRRHCGPLVKAMSLVREKHPHARFIVPRAPTIDPALLEPLKAAGACLVEGQTMEVLKASDAAVVAAGTATLEAAFVGTPQTVIWKIGRLNGILARWLLRTKWVSLVNILQRREVVKEFFQGAVRPEPIAEEVCALLAGARRDAILSAYREITESFGCGRAAEAVADVMDEAMRAKGRG